jgi:ATP-dependent DNA helicase RecG
MRTLCLEATKSGENQTIEFKTSFQKEIMESVVAFAHAKGGKISIGIKDNSEFIVRQASLDD